MLAFCVKVLESSVYISSIIVAIVFILAYLGVRSKDSVLTYIVVSFLSTLAAVTAHDYLRKKKIVYGNKVGSDERALKDFKVHDMLSNSSRYEISPSISDNIGTIKL